MLSKKTHYNTYHLFSVDIVLNSQTILLLNLFFLISSIFHNYSNVFHTPDFPFTSWATSKQTFPCFELSSASILLSRVNVFRVCHNHFIDVIMMCYRSGSIVPYSDGICFTGEISNVITLPFWKKSTFSHANINNVYTVFLMLFNFMLF